VVSESGSTSIASGRNLVKGLRAIEAYPGRRGSCYGNYVPTAGRRNIFLANFLSMFLGFLTQAFSISSSFLQLVEGITAFMLAACLPLAIG